MTTLLFLAALMFEPPAPAWYASENYPGWEGFGVPQNGLLEPQRWRRIEDHAVEYIRDGDPVPDGYTKIEAPSQPGDPFGFVAWLNGQRAAVGLAGVAWDQSMANAAAINNSYQVVYGMGHHAMAGARRQNAAMMAWPGFLTAWLGSAGHRAALLDPGIHWVGLAGSGIYWTFSAR